MGIVDCVGERHKEGRIVELGFRSVRFTALLGSLQEGKSQPRKAAMEKGVIALTA